MTIQRSRVRRVANGIAGPVIRRKSNSRHLLSQRLRAGHWERIVVTSPGASRRAAVTRFGLNRSGRFAAVDFVQQLRQHRWPRQFDIVKLFQARRNGGPERRFIELLRRRQFVDPTSEFGFRPIAVLALGRAHLGPDVFFRK
nr:MULTISPECIES: hypothetical protein [unclassified Sphingopyxis]